MSTLVVALLVITLIALAIALLVYAGKRAKRKLKNKILNYVHQVTRETGVHNDFQKHLVHQTVIIDELMGKLLVIDHRKMLSHEVYDLRYVDNIRVITEQQALHPRNRSKPDTIVTKVGVQFTQKDGGHRLLVLYDHLEHNIYQMDVYVREAKILCEKIQIVQKIKERGSLV